MSKEERKYFAELFGTMLLVLAGCGTLVFTGSGDPNIVRTSLAFGLAYSVGLWAFGPVSGCHINPAVTLGMYFCRRIGARQAVMYCAYQITGGMLGALILWVLSDGYPGWTTRVGASDWNGDTAVSTVFFTEFLFTALIVFVYLSVDRISRHGLLSLLFPGLALTLASLVALPITGASFNPARSIGPALFESGASFAHLWLFILAPLLGGSAGAGLWQLLYGFRKRSIPAASWGKSGRKDSRL